MVGSSRWRRGALGLSVMCAGLAAAPRRGSADPEPLRQPYWVDFEAGDVVVDGDLKRLELDRDVVIRVDRYRLTSQKLVLSRTAQGVVVDGEGRVSFCRCERPPITFGFRQAIVAPPTDLFVRSPTVRLYDVPILWLPVLWLRAPDRLGLLPPRIAWRGRDGLVTGAGVHVPIGGQRGPSLETLDLFASGYLQGGVDLEGRLATESSSTTVRWDHLHADLLALDSHGATRGESGATGAYRLDVIRGARGRHGTLELEPAARRYDRGRAALIGSGGGFVGALGAHATLARSGPLDELGTVGPEAHVGFGTATGARSALDTSLSATSVRRVGHATTSLAVERGRFEAASALGPLWVGATLSERALLVSEESEHRLEGEGGARARAALPFWRGFGDGGDPWVHRVEPFVDGGARASSSRGDALTDYAPPLPGRTYLALAGLETSLGRMSSRSGLTADVRGGAIGQSSLSGIFAASLSGSAAVYALSADAAIEPEHGRSHHAGVHARLGREDELHLITHVEGQGEQAPLGARFVGAESWDAPRTAWLDSAGWSAAGRLGIPWTRELATAIGADADVTRERLLAIRGVLGYRHRCGCLAAVAALGHRVGREGLDAEIRLDLMP